MGIITFNQTQQELIEDLLDDARRKHPDIEPFFQTDYFEPVFVKNIENVQGDERDIIFFSICFAKPEKNKRVSMNFGPLNREGGERRLNVAITRAKESIFVFSSIHYDELDLNRTPKVGPAHLKNFLEYAEKGTSVLGNEITGAHLNKYDSPFEEEVAQFLRNHNYEIHTQVGTSGYRIDLAVVSQTHPGRYVLGIECDGASYHRAATVRDRDKLRQRVLEGLGWQIIRVWSTDWWNAPMDTKRNLLRCIEAAIENEQRNQVTTASQSVHSDEMIQAELKLESDSTVTRKEATLDDCICTCEFAEEYPSLDYLQAEDIFKNLYSESFYETQSVEIIKSQINMVLAKEAPIVESLLMKRIVQAWGFQRTGEKISNILELLMPDTYTISDLGEKVYWLNKSDSRDYNKFRSVSSEQSAIRKLDEIPLEELKNAMKFINSEYQTFYGEEALFKETAKLFGFSRLTSQAQNRYKAALNLLKKSKEKVNIIVS